MTRDEVVDLLRGAYDAGCNFVYDGMTGRGGSPPFAEWLAEHEVAVAELVGDRQPEGAVQ